MSLNVDDVQINGVKSAVIVTGTYAGDGSTGLAITGLGFQPIYVLITERETAPNANLNIYFTTTQVIDDHASGAAVFFDDLKCEMEVDAIKSLDSDGFTVSDGGVNDHPNKAGLVYNFIALG